jgi:hypothetical protein
MNPKQKNTAKLEITTRKATVGQYLKKKVVQSQQTKIIQVLSHRVKLPTASGVCVCEGGAR